MADNDVLELVTDAHLQKALRSRREFLIERLAEIQVDKMMPEYKVNPEIEKGEQILLKAVEEIDNRLNGASEVLRKGVK